MKVFALFLAIMMTGLSPDRIPGHYVLEGAREMGSELLLKPDGQFEYMLFYGAADYVVTGKWRAVGDTIVLDSKPVEGAPFRLVSSTQQRSPAIRVRIKGRNGSPVPNLDVVLMTSAGEEMARTDQAGVALFQSKGSPKSVRIEVSVYNVNAGPYTLNPAHNNFNFEINGDAITTVPFRGEVLRIKDDTLELLYWDKTAPMVYRKQK